MFVEGIHAEEDLTADIARDAVGVADQGGVLLQHSKVQLELLKARESLKPYGLTTLGVTYLGRVRPETRLGGETLAAEIAVERAALGPLDLGVVVAKVLLQVRQLDERSAALRQVAFVRALAYRCD